jgi:hypothetical protein
MYEEIYSTARSLQLTPLSCCRCYRCLPPSQLAIRRILPLIRRRKFRARSHRWTSRVAQPHASRGGSRGYGQETRDAVVRARQNGDDTEHAPTFAALIAEHTWPSIATQNRWHNRQNLRGNSRPFVQQGNNRAIVLRGQDAVKLALYRCAYPNANAHEVDAFLFNASGQSVGLRRLYCPSQISRAEFRLGLSSQQQGRIDNGNSSEAGT